jgi:hypothetical protein
VPRTLEKEDFYIDEKGRVVFTEKFHLKRGFCCKSPKGCKHCPWEEKYIAK